MVLVIPGGKTHLAFVRMVIEASQRGQPLGLDELLIVHELQVTRQMTIAGAARLPQKSESDTRGVLENIRAIG